MNYVWGSRGEGSGKQKSDGMRKGMAQRRDSQRKCKSQRQQQQQHPAHTHRLLHIYAYTWCTSITIYAVHNLNNFMKSSDRLPKSTTNQNAEIRAHTYTHVYMIYESNSDGSITKPSNLSSNDDNNTNNKCHG